MSNTIGKRTPHEHFTESLDMCYVEDDREDPSLSEALNGTFKECPNYLLLRDENRQLNNKLKSVRRKLQEKRNELTKVMTKLDGMKLQDNLNTDVVEENVALSGYPRTDEVDISEEEGGTDDSTYETEEELTTEAKSEDDKDLII
ncbi:hypothetical protein AWC38_SpisGene20111 [Stylophora pistillata]|uniref:Uncharacterized protein n=1 Tax=Stylophora pistillata TaxID=50429 RepID=A0A2B4RER3_STYPI|nr:hypothetical protein AWC38_SpisGene20111 [Stylophora pistillata]